MDFKALSKNLGSMDAQNHYFTPVKLDLPVERKKETLKDQQKSTANFWLISL